MPLLNLAKKLIKDPKNAKHYLKGELKASLPDPLQIVKQGKTLIFGLNDYSPNVRHILEDFGDKKIKRIEIYRTPLPSFINTTLDVLSLGKFGKQNPYDKLFHLFLILYLEGGTKILWEKNEQINSEVNPSLNFGGKEEKINVEMKEPITLSDFVNKTQKLMGKKYFNYSASKNNCQDFVLSCLKANGLENIENSHFIKQELEAIFKDLGYLAKFSNILTTTRSNTSVILDGAGRSRIGILEDIPIPQQLRILCSDIITFKKNQQKVIREYENGTSNIENVLNSCYRLLKTYQKIIFLLDQINPKDDPILNKFLEEEQAEKMILERYEPLMGGKKSKKFRGGDEEDDKKLSDTFYSFCEKYYNFLDKQRQMLEYYQEEDPNYLIVNSVINDTHIITKNIDIILGIINNFPQFDTPGFISELNQERIRQNTILNYFNSIELQDNSDVESDNSGGKMSPLMKYVKEYNDLMGMDLTIPEFVILVKHNKSKFTKKIKDLIKGI